jgi:hypothetical protein
MYLLLLIISVEFRVNVEILSFKFQIEISVNSVMQGHNLFCVLHDIRKGTEFSKSMLNLRGCT